MRRRIGSALLTLAACATLSVGCSDPTVDGRVSDGAASSPDSGIGIDSSSNEMSEMGECEHYSGENPSWEKLIEDYEAKIRQGYAMLPQGGPEYIEERWEIEQQSIDYRNPETNVSKKDIYTSFPPGGVAAVGKEYCKNVASNISLDPGMYGTEEEAFLYLKNPPGTVMVALIACQEASSRPKEKFPELYQGSNLKIYKAACPQYL